MQKVAERRNGAAVYVDYAHTPDAVRTALSALRPHVMGRLVVVLGAGGDRDRGKPPLMGRAAADGADMVFVTDDNPRTEDAESIRAAVLQGASDAVEVGDRAEAILRGVDALGEGDALLIAGKGHETGQVVGSHDLSLRRCRAGVGGRRGPRRADRVKGAAASGRARGAPASTAAAAGAAHVRRPRRAGPVPGRGGR